MNDTGMDNFQDKLRILHEVSTELARATNLDDLYRGAIVLGRERLGFDRMGLMLVDTQAGEIYGTYGVDTEGNLRDERDWRYPLADDAYVMEAIRNNQRVQYWEDTDLLDEWQPVGRGWLAAAMIWDGDRSIGWLAADNLIHQEPLRPHQLDILTLYATTIGQLIARRRAETTARIAQSRLSLLVERSPLAVVQFDHDFIITDWNPAAERIFGYTAEEAIGQHALRLMTMPELISEVAERFVELDDTPPGYTHGINENITKDGKIIICEWHNFPLIDDRGTFVGYAAKANDITERFHDEQRRMELEMEREKVEFLRTFIGNITHDLKNPLTSIRMGLDLLVRHPDPDKREEKIAQLYEHTERLENLIQNLLTISRLDHLPELNYEWADLNGLVRDVLGELRLAIERKQIRLMVDMDTTLPRLYMDSHAIRSAIMNVAENAINYTPAEQVVSIVTDQREGEVVMTITDSGIGIPEDELEYIFDRFYRAHKARSLVSAGSGIGLSIVKRAVELHNGRVEVRSAPGVGTTFRLYLPVMAERG